MRSALRAARARFLCRLISSDHLSVRSRQVVAQLIDWVREEGQVELKLDEERPGSRRTQRAQFSLALGRALANFVGDDDEDRTCCAAAESRLLRTGTAPARTDAHRVPDDCFLVARYARIPGGLVLCDCQPDDTVNELLPCARLGCRSTRPTGALGPLADVVHSANGGECDT